MAEVRFEKENNLLELCDNSGWSRELGGWSFSLEWLLFREREVADWEWTSSRAVARGWFWSIARDKGAGDAFRFRVTGPGDGDNDGDMCGDAVGDTRGDFEDVSFLWLAPTPKSLPIFDDSFVFCGCDDTGLKPPSPWTCCSCSCRVISGYQWSNQMEGKED